MSENVIKEKTAAAPADEDLSREIEQALERQIDDKIKVVRLYDDCYRCNWWVQDKASQPVWISTGTIRKSSFVRATKTSEGLQIKVTK